MSSLLTRPARRHRFEYLGPISGERAQKGALNTELARLTWLFQAGKLGLVVAAVAV